MPDSALPSPEHEGSSRSGNSSQSAAVPSQQSTQQPQPQQQHQPRVNKESPVSEHGDSQTLKLPSIRELIGIPNDMGPPYYHQQQPQQPPSSSAADQQQPLSAHPYPQSSQNQPPPNYAPASASPTGSAAAVAPPNGYVAANSRSIDPNLQTPASIPPQNGAPYTPNSSMPPPPPMMAGPYGPYPGHHVYPSPSGQHAVPVWPGQYHPDPRRNPESPLMHSAHPGDDDHDLWRHQQAPVPYNINYGPVSPAGSNSTERYACTTCNKSFSRPSSLRIHNHSHTGEKPFICGVKGCGKAFSVRSNMKRHERGCHPTAA